MRHAADRFFVCVALLALAAAPAKAQVTEVATFTLGGHSSSPPDVAVGTDGTIVFIWTEFEGGERRALTRRYSTTGEPLALAIPIDSTGAVRETAISVRPDGSLIAAWHLSGGGSALYGRRLDALGAPLAPSFKVTVEDRSAELRTVTGLPSGSFFLWRQRTLRARLYNAVNTATGPEFILDDSASAYADAAALPDGGYIVVADGFNGGPGGNSARLFDGDGTPRGPAVSLGPEFRSHRVAVSPIGSIVVVGTGTGFGGNPGGIWMRRLDLDGQLIGSAVLVRPAYDDERWVPDVELDFQGNALVVWAGTDLEESFTGKVRGRAYDAANAPLGHEFVVANEFAAGVRAARLADGRLVTVWNPGGSVSAKVLSLCLPGVAQCGDGVVHPECEQCDDGAANSDTAPDACRTDCSLPRCGDGAVDSAEQCDDTNFTNCDGCSATCVAEPGLVCGDGIPEPTCSQPCDDANATVGDGCTSQCALEPIPGGGSRATDCRTVWIVDNPGNDPLTDNHGVFRSKQRCVDDDPECDFDGGTPGGCTFHVRVCANASGMTDCAGGIRIATWGLDRPSAKQAATSPALAAARASFEPVPGAIVGPTTSDVCSDWLSVPVPLKGVPGDYRKGKLTLRSRAILYDGDEDKDKLNLECLPADS